ncbi:MAG: DUF1949 domain-containing protein, partial [Clostridia bacterium]|nr:DUF1949 domain-containing protein [Clostridia bacterium]
TMVLCREVKISCDYSLLGKIQNEILNQGLKISETEYQTSVTVSLLVPVSRMESFSKNMIDKTNGKIGIELGETGYNKL